MKLFDKIFSAKIMKISGLGAGILLAITFASYMVFKEIIFAFEIVYFCGLCAVLYFLTSVVFLQSKKKAFRENTHVAFSAMLVLGIVIFIYLIAYSHHKLFDVTSNKRFSLSEQTTKIITSLDQDIELLAFLKNMQPEKEQIERMLQQYAYQSSRISYRIIDPQEYPTITEEYAITKFGEMIIRAENKKEKVDFPSEEGITNAILKLLQNTKPRIAVLTGHSELSLDVTDKTGLSLLKRFLELENYETEEVLLLREDTLSSDIDCFIIPSPKTELFENEIETIRTYYQNGGSVLVLIDPDAPVSVETFLDSLGIDMKEGILVDTLSQVFGASALVPVVTQYVPHAITENFRVASFFPTARFVDVKTDLPDGVTGYALAYTGPGSWVEMDKSSLAEKPVFNKDVDIPGPVPVIAMLEGTVDQVVDDANASAETAEDAVTKTTRKASRLVVVGDSTFTDNATIGLSGNKDVVLNIIAWLTRDEQLISIRKKADDSQPLFLTGVQQLLVFIIPVVVMPLAALVIGIFVALRFRRE